MEGKPQVKHQLKRQSATKILKGSGKDGKVKDETEKRLTDTQRKDARKDTKTLK